MKNNTKRIKELDDKLPILMRTLLATPQTKYKDYAILKNRIEELELERDELRAEQRTYLGRKFMVGMTAVSLFYSSGCSYLNQPLTPEENRLLWQDNERSRQEFLNHSYKGNDWR